MEQFRETGKITLHFRIMAQLFKVCEGVALDQVPGLKVFYLITLNFQVVSWESASAESNRWLSVKLQKIQCGISNRVTAILC